MIKEALQYLMSFRDVELIEHDGVKYSSQQMVKFPALKADHVTTKSLASIVNLVGSELSHARIANRKIIIQVVGPTMVNVFTTMDDLLDRLKLFMAEAEIPHLQMNTYIDLEAMNIHLKSCFVPVGERDELIKLLGTVTEEAVKTLSDDGFSQQVTAKTGVASVSNVVLNPIVKLTPYRTFLEVDQPTGEFLVRMQSGHKVALFEADGGAWKIETRKRVKAYFDEALKDLVTSKKVIVLE